MTGRNRRGGRRAGMKARIGVAAAVLIGGGAAGVAVVAANNHDPASTTVSDAGFIMGFHHRISEQTALSSALSMWGSSHQASMNELAQMAPMRNFSQFWEGRHHRTEFAAQRGVVVLATKKFLLVKSSNRQLHLWWLTRGTAFENVTASATGMTAMTGNNTAAVNAMVNQNTTTAQTVMAGSTTAVAQAASPTKPTTITIVTGTETITITITPTTATVTQPGTTATTTTATGTPTATSTGTATATATPTVTATGMPTATPTGTASASATPTMTATATPSPTVTATQPVTTATHGVAAGDLVMIAGVREHGRLIAELVLFSVPATTTATPTATPSVSVSTSATSSAVPTITPTPSGITATISGSHS
jgi:hypothetical protein